MISNQNNLIRFPPGFFISREMPYKVLRVYILSSIILFMLTSLSIPSVNGYPITLRYSLIFGYILLETIMQHNFSSNKSASKIYPLPLPKMSDDYNPTGSISTYTAQPYLANLRIHQNTPFSYPFFKYDTFCF